jgi:uncharacterized protein
VTIPAEPQPQPAPEVGQTHSQSAARDAEQREFLGRYWEALTTGKAKDFAPYIAENCVVHYPGNHFLSGDHVGREAIVALYDKLYKLGVEQGTFIGELHDVVTSDVHACALVKYRIVVAPGMEIPGEAIGVFHIADGQMVEYWLLERDQKMINDIVKMSGKASLAGGSKAQMALGAVKQPAPLARTIRRVLRVKRGTAQKMI